LAIAAGINQVHRGTRSKLNPLLTSKLATARACNLKEGFQHFWAAHIGA